MWVVVAVLVTMAMMPMVTMAADADPLQDFCVADNSTGLTINGFPCKPAAKVSVQDFIFAGLKKAGNTNKPNMALVTSASVIQFPGLNTLGISAARVDIAKGGLNAPHIHPRATELLFLVQGELYVGFVSTNNTLFATVLRAGELFVFPRALAHFELNVGQTAALGFGFLNSQNPGRQEFAPALFTPDIKDEVLELGFRIDAKTVDMIQAKFRV
jgi:quercetin dioxygenase-like cupin family protein